MNNLSSVRSSTHTSFRGSLVATHTLLGTLRVSAHLKSIVGLWSKMLLFIPWVEAEEVVEDWSMELRCPYMIS